MSDRLTIKVVTDTGEEERTLFMSFGLLNEFCGHIGVADRIGMIGVDPDLTNALVTVALIPRKPNGRPAVDIDSYDIPGVSVEDAEKILDWIGDAALSFFVRCAEKTVKRVEGKGKELASLKSSLPGSQPSP